MTRAWLPAFVGGGRGFAILLVVTIATATEFDRLAPVPMGILESVRFR